MRFGLQWLVYTAVCLALAVAVQSLRLGQAVTGPAVNAVLLVAAGYLGPAAAVTVGLLTPGFALLLGVLKPVLAPAVPFIMVGNAVMVLAFWRLLRQNRYMAVTAAALAKFLALWLPVTYLLRLPAPVTVALGWPQLMTAAAGGAAALAVLAALPALRVRAGPEGRRAA